MIEGKRLTGQINVRLGPETLRLLADLQKQTGKSQSEIIREALEMLAARQQEGRG